MRLRRRRNIWDVAVIGGGITGLTAAWHAMRRGLTTTLFEGAPAHGGLVANVNHLDDFPGTTDASGVELAANLVQRLHDENVDLRSDAVQKVALEGPFVRLDSEQGVVRARRVLVASGARLKRLGVPGEEKLVGKGVSQCADCDGFFFRDQDVVVVGGGDGALHEALVLAGICRTVTIVARSRLRARAVYVEKAAGAANVRFAWDSVVESVLGDAAVTGVKLRNVRTGEMRDMPCTGVFPFIGCEPTTGFLDASAQRDATGALITDTELRTSIPGVLAAGAVRAGYSGTLAAAVGEAATAAAVMARDLAL